MKVTRHPQSPGLYDHSKLFRILFTLSEEFMPTWTQFKGVSPPQRNSLVKEFKVAKIVSNFTWKNGGDFGIFFGSQTNPQACGFQKQNMWFSVLSLFKKNVIMWLWNFQFNS